jgi:hypothetical protein
MCSVFVSVSCILILLHVCSDISLICKHRCNRYVIIEVVVTKYTGCPRRNVPDFGRVFLILKYTDITQNTYVQS